LLWFRERSKGRRRRPRVTVAPAASYNCYTMALAPFTADGLVAIPQILAILGLPSNWNPWAVFTGLSYVLALLTVPSVLLQRQGRPQAALSWLLVLFAFPYLGLLLWWAIGRKHLARRKRKQRRAAEKISRRIDLVQSELPSVPKAEWKLMSFEHLPPADREWAFAPTLDNAARLLVDGEETYGAIEKMIREARHHIHLLFYIWQNDATGVRLRDLLIERAKAGIEVRVLLDAVGSYSMSGRAMNPLREAGGKVKTFMPPRFLRMSLELNFRNHRKMALVDGCTAVMGGLNIGDEYLRWRDTALQLRGPVVDQLQEVFAEDWYFAAREDFTGVEYFGGWRDGDGAEVGPPNAMCGLVASGPHTELNLTHEAFFSAIGHAERRVYLTTPYLVPDQVILAALRTAVLRGVDVRILVPWENDEPLVRLASRSYYLELLRYGVRIFEYHGRMMHAKSAAIDDDLSFVGSANMDIRSFRLNFELNCFVKGAVLNRQMTEVFLRDLAHSREVTLEDIEQSSYVARLVEATAHLLSPLL